VIEGRQQAPLGTQEVDVIVGYGLVAAVLAGRFFEAQSARDGVVGQSVNGVAAGEQVQQMVFDNGDAAAVPRMLNLNKAHVPISSRTAARTRSGDPELD